VLGRFTLAEQGFRDAVVFGNAQTTWL